MNLNITLSFTAALLTLTLALAPDLAQAQIGVKLGAPWDGRNIPPGQQCKIHGGTGATPPMQLSGLPDGTAMVLLSFNDQNYRPLSQNGGHGQIGFAVSGPEVSLPAVPGMTKQLPEGITVVNRAKSGGTYASPGYLPPCSGGKGHLYTVDILALDGAGKTLEALTLPIGKY